MTIVVDGRKVSASQGQTVLDVCRAAGIRVPALCHDPRLKPYGACRLCIVKIDGEPGYPTSCSTEVRDGMVVHTATPEVLAIRRTIVELLLSDHTMDCLACESAGACGLQNAAYELQVTSSPFDGERHSYQLEDLNPLIARDPSKCIRCGRCVRICKEVQGCYVFDWAWRGFDALPTTAFDRFLSDTQCEFCGQCVSTCPTGALANKMSRFQGRKWERRKTDTICGYCGVGCTLTVETKDDRVVGVSAPLERGVNRGNLCIKGRYGFDFVDHPDRLKTPLIRRGGELVPVTWEEALDEVVRRLTEIRDTSGPHAIAGLASAKCTNEENYLFQKLLRAGLGTNSVDNCARLCHSSSVVALGRALGSAAMTNSIDDLGEAEVILVTGSNTTEAHPVIGLALKAAAARGTKIVVAEPRRIKLVDFAHSFVRIRPGTNTAFFNGLMHVILAEGLEDRKFIEERTENIDELERTVAAYTPERVAEITGATAEEIRQTARLYAQAKAAAIVFSMGITQFSSGTDQAAAIANLAMLTGNIGRPGTGVNPLRGHNNVQGACDMGCLSVVFPGYARLDDPEAQDRFSSAWGRELPAWPGLTLMEMFDAAHDGALRALYVMGENPVVADAHQAHVIGALEALDFLVVQDIFLTDTARLADVVLPAASWLEKDGTFTNTERRVQLVRQVVAPRGQARPDWRILADLLDRFGVTGRHSSPAAIMDEIASLVPQFGGVSHKRLENGGLQWPCPTKRHPGTPILHTESFTRGRGLFVPAEYIPPAEEPSDDFPFVMTTGRVLPHFHTGTMTRRSAGIDTIYPEGFVELNPNDAKALGVQDGGLAEVSSRRGAIRMRVKVTDAVSPGVIFVPFHFVEAPANRLTASAPLDPHSKMAPLKVTAVNVTALAETT